jgi:hypothetical protein
VSAERERESVFCYYGFLLHSSLSASKIARERERERFPSFFFASRLDWKLPFNNHFWELIESALGDQTLPAGVSCCFTDTLTVVVVVAALLRNLLHLNGVASACHGFIFGLYSTHSIATIKLNSFCERVETFIILSYHRHTLAPSLSHISCVFELYQFECITTIS